MSNLAKLKKKAADLEQKRQLDKALPLYQQIVDGQGDGDDADVALCNRVGDLLHRAGRVNEAISYWERAVEMYSARGFLDNAIAICRKILRASPASVGVHHKLGVMHAKKGLRNDAKLHFLEYADRMQRLGEMDEAFKALREFADLCPEHDDVRQSLAEQLIRHERVPEALEQLDILHARYRQTGSVPEAEATLERIRSLDPAYELHAVLPPAEHDQEFLMVNGGRGKNSPSSGAGDGLVLIGPEATATPTPPASVDGIEFGGSFEAPARPRSELDVVEEEYEDPAALGVSHGDDLSLDGFEPTSMHSEPNARDTDAMISPANTLHQLDTPDPAFALPPRAGFQDAPADAGEMELLDGDFDIGGNDSATDSQAGHSDEEDVRSHRSEDGDAAAELAAEAQRRGHQPDVMDQLGVGDPDDAIGDLPLIDTAEPYEAESAAGDDGALELSASGSEDSFELMPDLETLEDSPSVEALEEDSSSLDADAAAFSGDPDASLIELPDIEADAHLDEGASDYEESAPLWDASPVASSTRENAPGWRRTSDMLRADGDTEGALRELDSVLEGFLSTGDLVTAGDVVDEMISIEPRIGYHRQRVDLAFKGDDRVRLRLAYEGLADALTAAGDSVEAASVRQRMADLDSAGRLAAAPGSAVFGAAAGSAGQGVQAPQSHAEPASSQNGLAEFVNLGDLLRADEPERTTRMVVEEQAPSGDEQADFAEMLAKFRQGLEENVDADDFESHHDLGVAFREMGLLDEAIVEFQKALRGTGRRLRTFEALGECFVEKEQFQLASATLRRALQETNEEDDQFVGVWYLLGVSLDALDQREEAVKLYERVLAVDYGFRDAADRVNKTVRAVS